MDRESLMKENTDEGKFECVKCGRKYRLYLDALECCNEIEE